MSEPAVGAARPARYVTAPEFTRDTHYISDRITAAVSEAPDRPDRDPQGRRLWPAAAGRYRLIAARACPWAHRAVIVRRLLGLEEAISLGIAGPTHDERSWLFDLDPQGLDPVLGIHWLREAYEARMPGYPRGITVPAIVDIPSGQVVTNDFAQITVDMSTEWAAHHRTGAPALYPSPLRAQIDEVSRRIYTEVNNGVYRCGFAGSQAAYEQAHNRLFAALDGLETRLTTRRFLVGDTITEADIRLFTTLVRFDAVYHGHFKCNRQRLTQFPSLWGYARDLFQTPGFGDTTDFVQIKQHYYVTHGDLNPTRVVPVGPDLTDWSSPHGREELGGRPFGDGTPPGPPHVAERVPAEHYLGVPTAAETERALASTREP